MDAAVKVVALVNSLGMGDPIRLSDVAVEARRRFEPRMVLHVGCTQRLSGVFNSAPKRTWYGVQGVRGITPERAAAAKAAGRSLRLVAGAELREGGEGGEGRITAYVRPEELEPGWPP